MKQLDKAAGYAKRANELQPKNASFEDTYAWILFKQKKYAEAKVWIEKAIADNTSKSALQTEHYGDIMFHTGNVDAAVSNWKKARIWQHHLCLTEKTNERSILNKIRIALCLLVIVSCKARKPIVVTPPPVTTYE